MAGTTRDAIDTSIEFDGNKYVLIDTAGIRRKSKVEESLEYYSVLRAIKTIKRADVCLLMLDGEEGLTEQDKRIAGIAYEMIRYGSRNMERSLIRWAILPGLWMQKLTTREPSDKQLEVALAALDSALQAQGRVAGNMG